VAYIYNQAGLTDEEALETSGTLITAQSSVSLIDEGAAFAALFSDFL